MTRLYHALRPTPTRRSVHPMMRRPCLPRCAASRWSSASLTLAWIGFPRGRELVVEASISVGAARGIPPDELRPACLQTARPAAHRQWAAAGRRQWARQLVCLFLLRVADGGVNADGVLALRKDESGFFDEHTVRLIEELTADVAFALRSYRREDLLRLAAKVFENNRGHRHHRPRAARGDDDQPGLPTSPATTRRAPAARCSELFDPRPRGGLRVRGPRPGGGGRGLAGRGVAPPGDGESLPGGAVLSVVRSDDGQVTTTWRCSPTSASEGRRGPHPLSGQPRLLTGLPSAPSWRRSPPRPPRWPTRAGPAGPCVSWTSTASRTSTTPPATTSGDQLLIESARRLESVLRPGERVLRHGGDEFVVLIPEGRTAPGWAPGPTAAGGPRRALPPRRPREFSLSTSIGVAVYPRRRAGRRDPASTGPTWPCTGPRRRAAMASSSSPGHGLGGRRAPVLEYALRGALERDELVVLPAAGGGRRASGGTEALVRWREPELGLLLPGRFIPLAEESGDPARRQPGAARRVRPACRLARRRPAALPTAVNISACSSASADFVDSVADALRRYGHPRRAADPRGSPRAW